MNFRHLNKSEFVRNVLKVAGGSAGAQLITLAFIPVITRLFSPEDYGLLGVFTALLAILMPVAALTYPTAIALPKEKKQVLNIVSLSFAISLILFSFLILILVFFKNNLLSSLNIEALGDLIYLIPLAMLFNSFQQTNQQWLIRNSKYGFIGKISVFQAILINCTKTVAGFTIPSGGILIAISTFGYLLHGVMFVKGLTRDLAIAVKQLFTPDEYNEILNTAKKYSDFPKFRAPQTIVHALSQSIPVLLLGVYFSNIAVGFYALSMSVISAPVNLIGKSINDVFYPKAIRMVQEGSEVTSLLVKSTLTLLILGFIPLVSLFFLGEQIFGWIFGDEWRTGGSYAAWLSLWMLFFLATRPVISIIPVLGLQKWFLKNEILNLFFRVGVFYFSCVIFTDSLDVVAIFSILNVFIYCYIFFVVYHACNRIKSRN